MLFTVTILLRYRFLHVMLADFIWYPAANNTGYKEVEENPQSKPN